MYFDSLGRDGHDLSSERMLKDELKRAGYKGLLIASESPKPPRFPQL